MSRKRKSRPTKHVPADPVSEPQRPVERPRWNRGLVISAIVVFVVSSAIGSWLFGDWWIGIPSDEVATFVGRDSCIKCHQAEADAFHGSHHDLAMDLATEETVLGDFNDQEITHYGITSTLFRDGDRFMVRTEGEEGEMEDFEVKYVFGVEPLQQYMVEFDRPDDLPAGKVSRVQVLRISWDTEKKRWFYLSPPDVDEKLEPGDPLHWTGITQNWNSSCADCHSTNLQKNFLADQGRYETTFSEIDVSCEACHGPGSIHVKLASAISPFWDRHHEYGLAKLKSDSTWPEIQSCAPCHSRRRILQNGYHAGLDFHDYYSNELLGELTYHADGQILDEVYVYGSFIQSKMYHQDIRCTDCHDPHTARLKFEGNLVCTSCHQHPAGQYDTPAHHQHAPGTPGAACVNCHMPTTTYMDVDPRRDHSLRVPRPDLSVKHGTPNACSACHVDPAKLPADRTAQIDQYLDWLLLARDGDEVIAAELKRVDQQMADATLKWYPNSKVRREQIDIAEVLLSARRNESDSIPSLSELAANPQAPAIVRGTAAMELSRFQTGESFRGALAALDDDDPTVIAAALMRVEVYLIRLLNQLSSPQTDRQVTEALNSLIGRLGDLLPHPRRLVRMEAARVLAQVPEELRRTQFRRAERNAFKDAIAELKSSFMVNNDRAMAYVGLGVLHQSLGEIEEAEAAFRRGINVEPNTTGPRSHLAGFLDQEVQALSRRASEALVQRNETEHRRLRDRAAKLMLEVMALRAQELELLAIDVQRLPDSHAIQYRYGLALHLQGQSDKAEAALREAYRLAPDVPDYVLALALFYENEKRWDLAIEFTHELIALEPDNPVHRAVLERIRQGQRGGPSPPPPGGPQP